MFLLTQSGFVYVAPAFPLLNLIMYGFSFSSVLAPPHIWLAPGVGVLSDSTSSMIGVNLDVLGDAIVMLLPMEIAQIAPIHKGYKIDRTS